jgi:glycosyltransferase involved in cell wall biosynthesis
MRIALDATPLSVSTGGVRRYTEELSKALAQEFPDDRYELISDQQLPLPKSVLDRRWWLIGVQRAMSRLGIDLFHGTDFSVPYLALRPSVMTIHDLSPWMEARWHYAADRVRIRTPLLIRTGRAGMFITPSEAVRQQALARFRIHSDRIVTIPEAAPNWMRRVENTGSAVKPYFLYVGTLEPRKNIPVLLEAWRQVSQRHDVSLVIAGRRRHDFPALSEQPGLQLLGEVPDSALPGLYSGAVASVYPSLYEGFGLPVLEAMSCGAAVITSRDPAILEVSGDAAVHVNAIDANGLASAMEALLTHPEQLQYRREQSLKRASQFSWRRTAILTREVYVEAIRRFRS